MKERMHIRQFRYGSDNLGYLVFGRKTALAIDGGAVAEILAFCSNRGLALRYIANTHAHDDHTSGNQALIRHSGAQYLGTASLAARRKIVLEDTPIQIHATPGHTRDSLVFATDHFILSGDTLFNGTIGNCFSGDLAAFYHSILLLLSFPDDTIVYAGHDYVAESMRFARLLEPENRHIDPYLEKYDPRHVCSTLADEKKVNPYLRFNTPELINVLKSRGMVADTAWHRWESLMQIV